MIRKLIKIATAIGLCLLVAMPASAASAAGGPTTIQTPNFAGYSFYQPGGYVNGIIGDWTVPAVQCPTAGQPGNTGTPRAVIWAGLWGSNASIKANTAWLPQIGTDSQCVNGTAVYLGIFEMETNVAGGGAVSWGAGPYCFPNPISLPSLISSIGCSTVGLVAHPFAVTAGDQIEAEVDYLGIDTLPQYKGDLEFEFDLRNMTRSEYVYSDFVTTEPVDLADIVYQGGLILEDHNSYGGLADFGSASLKFAFLSVTGSGPIELNKWVMNVFGTQLATTGPLGAAPSYPFTVTFDCNGCLANGPCPPSPPCTKY
jgi:hypothetical protein